MIEFLKPDWPAPNHIHACTSTRKHGYSQPPYESFNLAQHVGDSQADVERNRLELCEQLQLPSEPLWLDQVHGTRVLNLDSPVDHCEGDASVTQQVNRVCAVLTADCLPVLFCDQSGQVVAAAHAGWRGLLAGILESTVQAMACEPSDVMAWMGPAIGPQSFEVGEEVRQAFIERATETGDAFTATRPGHYLADIYQLARLRLQGRGVQQIYGGDHCTFIEQDRFFSYRRDGETGRMVSLIWRDQ